MLCKVGWQVVTNLAESSPEWVDKGISQVEGSERGSHQWQPSTSLLSKMTSATCMPLKQGIGALFSGELNRIHFKDGRYKDWGGWRKGDEKCLLTDRQILSCAPDAEHQESSRRMNCSSLRDTEGTTGKNSTNWYLELLYKTVYCHS